MAAQSAPASPTAVPQRGRYYYVVPALDSAGNESDRPTRCRALPHFSIDWSNVQWPPSGAKHAVPSTAALHRLRPGLHRRRDRGCQVRRRPLDAQLGLRPGRARIRTRRPGPGAGRRLQRQLGQQRRVRGDESTRSRAGSYDYAYRYSTTAGRDWVHADLDGGAERLLPGPGREADGQPERRHNSSAVPAGLHVVSSGPASISSLGSRSTASRPVRLRSPQGDAAGGSKCDARTDDGTYIHRRHRRGGAYIHIRHPFRGNMSWNCLANSAPVTQLADVREMSITFAVSVPAATDATGRAVHIAGMFAGLGAGARLEPDPGHGDAGGLTTATDVTARKACRSIQYVLGD